MAAARHRAPVDRDLWKRVQPEGVLSEAVADRSVHRAGILLGAVRSKIPGSIRFCQFFQFSYHCFGESDLIRSIDLIDRGAPIRSPFLRECAYRQGLADENGAVLMRMSCRWDGSRVALPREVELCCVQISEYVRGKRRVFAGIPLDETAGTTFQWSVWRALRDIPFGQVRSYQEVADALVAQEADGKKEVGGSHARAVGAACGANPFMLLIPCHRVLGKDGKLTGFSGGIDNKAALLDFELMGVRPDT